MMMRLTAVVLAAVLAVVVDASAAAASAAAAAADASDAVACKAGDLQEKTCTHSPEARIASKDGLADASACCSLCASTHGCHAWTFWTTSSATMATSSGIASNNRSNNSSSSSTDDVNDTHSADDDDTSTRTTGDAEAARPTSSTPSRSQAAIVEEKETHCNLFGKRVPGTEGECVSGGTTGGKSPWVPPPPHGPICKDCPNIIFSLTDDQDYLLGGWGDVPMRHTKRLLQNTGALLSEWRIHTAICSPSRSETVSGRYFHNIKSATAVPPPKVLPTGAGHVNGSLYTNQTAGTYLRMLRGFQTALFGKGNFNTMEGFDRWFQGSHLGYGGTWQDNESPDFKYKASDKEYATDLLLEKASEWLRRDNVTGKASNGRPFFLYFAPHCPHIPSTPSDKYADACPNVTAPRTPNFNYSTPLFHELISKQAPFVEEEARAIDALARLRCQCLLSVDDAHAQLLSVLEDLGVANNTYWFVSSDHGYNLGNHRLPSNKFLLYEHSLRIPLVVHGPGVPAGKHIPVLGTNVDYAPTWLGLADIDTPPVMDGRSLVPVLLTNASADIPGATRRHLEKHGGPSASDPAAFRNMQFTQYYNQGPWQPDDPKDGFNRTLDDYSNTYIGITVVDPALGKYKYGEYQYVCNSTQMLTKTCFDDPDWYELFDLSADPYELTNIYYHANTNASLKQEMHRRLRQYYPCQGSACP
ncbi:hypothetical protein PTSG_11248 [Salpingoeca rosetta]|uniref:Sulfatase N-terminal domain-containing protein n=1 Tax=Salpingoeca rosetta (strain ATCC 50818 / BSB-021) TaxID=946362 RepID=F2USV4_SALR5|nr:uncharacterized protein PTSG_11248 [Salpingoeca rosetta]EGD81213.1 hypothetical protein PTSG_11248 [Salpingoeca rosetta]|eukprot:XP_004987747.1 hypothetical protein PTSG_11248 [Salpingoeca rosetta]